MPDKERADAAYDGANSSLVKLANHAELFHTPGGCGYANVVVGEHRETWPLKRMAFATGLVGSTTSQDGKRQRHK